MIVHPECLLNDCHLFDYNHKFLKDRIIKNPKKPVSYPSYWAQGSKNDIERESIRIKFYVLQRVNAQDK